MFQIMLFLTIFDTENKLKPIKGKNRLVEFSKLIPKLEIPGIV
jgi:hypothetical protein